MFPKLFDLTTQKSDSHIKAGFLQVTCPLAENDSPITTKLPSGFVTQEYPKSLSGPPYFLFSIILPLLSSFKTQ